MSRRLAICSDMDRVPFASRQKRGPMVRLVLFKSLWGCVATSRLLLRLHCKATSQVTKGVTKPRLVSATSLATNLVTK
eukprot:scaffold249_cov132-Isochrysis_galbana.AAC.1